LKRILTYLFLVSSFWGSAQLRFLPDTIGICPGSIDTLEVKAGVFAKMAAYEWNVPGKGIIYNTKRVVVKQVGRYILKVYYNKKEYVDTCIVITASRPKIAIRDTFICNNSTAVIEARNPSYKYSWSTEETGPRAHIETPGKYWVKADNKGCYTVDTFNVQFHKSSAPNFEKDVTFCLSDENKVLSIKPAPGTKISWSNGSNSSSIIPSKEGLYWVKTENKLCGVTIDSVRVHLKACDCEILIPNSFTPNEDDRNDYFYPVLTCDYSFYNITIYDRWNNTIFSSNNINAKWDGRYKGNLCPDDIYVYRIETIEKNSGKKDLRTGQISLFR
jgi:gliding motility-associated-like protein